MLILSALTAEGMAFFNTALVPLQNYMAGLAIDGEDKDESLTGAMDENPNIGPVQYKLTAFVPMAEILQAKDGSGGAFCYFHSFTPSYEPRLSYSLVSTQAFGAKIINISLNGSDISPPSL